jgi:LuxR family maltose regulon positive regulatory protein
MSRIRAGEGAPDSALDLLDEAASVYVPGLLPETRPIGAMKARIWITQGRLVDAQAWADRERVSAEDPLTFLREFDHITLARLLHARYRQDHDDAVIGQALRLMERLLEAAETASRVGSANEILILQALAHQARGRADLAVVPLERALARCEPEGNIRLFIDEGREMATLLNEAQRRNRANDYVRLLRNSFAPVHDVNVVTQTGRDALSERELQVLRMLSTELSGPQIARELFVSVNTLRTHTSHIFAKLAVSSRTAAVRRARETGLL